VHDSLLYPKCHHKVKWLPIVGEGGGSFNISKTDAYGGIFFVIRALIFQKQMPMEEFFL